MRRHSSFLLRCWDLDEQDERIEIEHIQSHDTTVVRSLEAAVEWIRVAHHDAGPDGVGSREDQR